MSMATVMGPTPPGTGVRWLATSTTWTPECDIKDFFHLFRRLGKSKKIGLIQEVSASVQEIGLKESASVDLVSEKVLIWASKDLVSENVLLSV